MTDAVVVKAHPTSNSLCGHIASALAETLRKKKHRIITHDLYAEGFDPVLPREELSRRTSLDELVLEHMGDLEGCRHLVLIYPDWWGMPPAILKGWLDRVFQPGTAYQWREDRVAEQPEPLLSEKIAWVVQTSDAQPLNPGAHWEKIFAYCGMRTGGVFCLDNLKSRTRIRIRDEMNRVIASIAQGLASM